MLKIEEKKGSTEGGRKRVKVVKDMLVKRRLEEKMIRLLHAYPGERGEPVYYIDGHGDYTGTVVYLEGPEDAWALSSKTLQEMARFYNIT